MIELDKQVQYFSEGDDITPVTKVIVNYGYDETGAVLSKTATASVDNGRTVEFTLTHFTDSSQVQTIANNILSSYQNLGYASFTATGAELDPAAELNDGVEVNGTTSVLGAIDFNFGKGIYADIEAQGINEDDDFGYVDSQTQAIKRNEADVKQASIQIGNMEIEMTGKVSFTDLETSGSTTINGDNITTGHLSADRIQSGTLTLGGQNNTNGTLNINNASNTTIGTWDNAGIVIRDNSQYTDLNNANIRICRLGTNNTHGVRLGTTQLMNVLNPSRYPNESIGTISCEWTIDGSTVDAHTLISPQSISIDDDGESMQIKATASTQTDTVIRTGGSCTNFTYTLKTWGRVAFLSLHLNASGTSVASGGNYFTGTLSAYKPLATVSSGAMWFEHPVGATLDTSGNIIVRELAWSSSAFSNGAIDVSFTYLF